MASDWYEEMEKAEQEYDAREYELAQEYSRGYEQGKADATKELPTSLYCDGFNDGYPKGRADAIDDALNYCNQNNDEGEECCSCCLSIWKNGKFEGCYLEQLKEQK